MADQEDKKSGRTLTPDGQKIRNLRISKGWDVLALASKAGCERRTVFRVEEGKPCYVQTIRAVAEALGVSLQELIVDLKQNDATQNKLTIQGIEIDDSKVLNSNVDINMPLEDLVYPELVKEFHEIFGRALTEYDQFKYRFINEKHEKKINVYYIPAYDNECQKPMYFYVIASATLHDEVIESLKRGDIPNFAVVVAKGYGSPDEIVKKRMYEYYGFKHESSVSI